jgi:hypothetical protein
MAFLAVLKCTPAAVVNAHTAHFTKAVAQKSSAAPNLGRSTLLIFYSSGAHTIVLHVK